MKIQKQPGRKTLIIGTLIAIAVFGLMTFPAPALAVFTHDNEPVPLMADNGCEARFIVNAGTQVFGMAIDVLGGQFARGATGMAMYTNNDALKLESGFRHITALPEQFLARTGAVIGVTKVKFYETSDLALMAANNRIYSYAKVGALTGGLLAVAYAPIAGTTTVQTYAVGTAAGAIGGALTGAVIDATAGQ